MRGQWALKAVRYDLKRSCVRRVDGSDRFKGTACQALEFSARAQAHLCNRGIIRVEAWSTEQMEFDFVAEIEQPRIVFVIKRHRNGRDWLAEQNELHHGGWWRELRPAIDYAFFRGCRKVCAVHVVGAGKIEQVILADQRGWDSTPVVGPSIEV